MALVANPLKLNVKKLSYLRHLPFLQIIIKGKIFLLVSEQFDILGELSRLLFWSSLCLLGDDL